MTVPRLAAITHYQMKQPPTHLLVAAYMGVGKDEEGGSSKPTSKAKPGEVSDEPSLFDFFPTTRP